MATKHLREKAASELLSLVRTLPTVRLGATLSVGEKGLGGRQYVVAGEEAAVSVSVEVTSRSSRRFAYAPRFPKPKMAGWWLVMGEEEELFALKRIHLDRGKLTTELKFEAPEEPGEYVHSLWLISDSYIGLDQQVQLNVTVM